MFDNADVDPEQHLHLEALLLGQISFKTLLELQDLAMRIVHHVGALQLSHGLNVFTLDTFFRYPCNRLLAFRTASTLIVKRI